MTNAERRTALNEARALAFKHAQAAENLARNYAPGYAETVERAKLALMWAAVAEAMKDGDPVHDGPDGRPANGFKIPENVELTR